ncbi:MAG TPA: hypothetical protein VMU29_08665 [Smithella sp.]|nr:hypothetical protein [Smithella sp.]
MKTKITGYFILILLIIFSMTGCAPHMVAVKKTAANSQDIIIPANGVPDIIIPKDFDIPSSGVKDKIPLKAGLYIPPKFKNLIYRQPVLKGQITDITLNESKISIGEAFSSGSERMLNNIFSEVRPVNDLQILEQLTGLDVIITPELIKCHNIAKVNAPSLSWPKAFLFQLEVKWNIVSPDGKVIYLNTISNETTYMINFTDSAEEHKIKIRESLTSALKDQFQKAQTDLYTNGWWKKQWWKN